MSAEGCDDVAPLREVVVAGLPNVGVVVEPSGPLVDCLPSNPQQKQVTDFVPGDFRPLLRPPPPPLPPQTPPSSTILKLEDLDCCWAPLAAADWLVSMLGVVVAGATGDWPAPMVAPIVRD